MRLVVLRGATHAFDFPEPRRRYLGHLLEYDPDATRAAAAQARAFLQAAFAARPALPPARPDGYSRAEIARRTRGDGCGTSAPRRPGKRSARDRKLLACKRGLRAIGP